MDKRKDIENDIRNDFKEFKSENYNLISFMELFADIFDSKDLNLRVKFIKKIDNLFYKLMGLHVCNDLSDTQYVKLINLIRIFENDLDDLIREYNLKINEDKE